MTTEQKEFLRKCSALYRNNLVNDIMPFWMKNGLDTENGGVYTCLNREGNLMDSTKSVWFQGRFAFICAYAYNHIVKNEEWLRASRKTLEFIEHHCIDTDGHMFFSVTAKGKPVRKRRYVFSECFAAIAMAEYAKAAESIEYGEKALKLFLDIRRMLVTPGFLEPKSYVEAKGHSIVMMLINVAGCIRQVIKDPILDEQIACSIKELKELFMHNEFKTLLEMVGPHGEFIDTNEGRTINPGHCLETAWFIWEESRYRGWDIELNNMASIIALWAWEWGWDKTYGGILNFKDCKNFPPQDYSQDMKFWWPQTEAIIATLYGYIATGDEHYLELHRQVHEYTYKTFPDSQYGEWYGYLHRDGTVAQDAKGNLFKGPFHIPRMMIKASMLCDEILTNSMLGK